KNRKNRPIIYRNKTAIAVLRTEPHLRLRLRYSIFKYRGYRKPQSIAAWLYSIA
ncbi:unnamed protein product, partial [Prunus brigantina]